MSDCLTISDSAAGLSSLGSRNRSEGNLTSGKRSKPSLSSSYCVWFAWGLPRLSNAPTDALLHGENFKADNKLAVFVYDAVQIAINVKILS